jgi:transposase
MWRSGRAYSQDLRDRVLRAIDDGGKAYEVAALFQVSVSYVYKALIRRRRTGETSARAQCSHRVARLEGLHAAIAAEVKRRPDVTLEELRRWLEATHATRVSLGTMHNTLVRLGLTFKKSPAGQRSKIARTSPGEG